MMGSSSTIMMVAFLVAWKRGSGSVPSPLDGALAVGLGAPGSAAGRG